MKHTMKHPAFRLIAAAGLLGLVWIFADGRAALARIMAADWRWLVAAALMVNAQTVLSAERWRITAGALGQTIGRAQAVGEYYLSQLVNQTAPGGVLGDAGRAVRARHSADLLRSSQAVIIERFAGQIAMALVLLPALVWTGRWQWALLLAMIAAAVAMIARAVPRLRGLRAPLHAALIAPDMRGPQIALGLAIVACNLASFAFCARAIGTALPIGAVLTVIPLILTAMLMPLSVAGWGWREGAAAALFPMFGAAPEAGLAASAAFGAVLLACTLPGLIWITLRKPSPPSPREIATDQTVADITTRPISPHKQGDAHDI